ncbi:MAG: ABC transporter ATP-binding permease protein [Parcubacteria group bacterium GW2011_GWD1_44_9]|nr:MAG: ABC transporter ATP-binding permease protein [Parcubacteria group bacterium GW2011_GWC1_43_30]KKT84423.1 MAG: ABC transporter ATP-binding permease protein [Parcubacteria group bacterium GW2011_GWD1_44_9]
MQLIQVKNLTKTFIDGEKETRVLKNIDFSAEQGEWISIMGRSGAGKSTLMYQMSLLDDPTSGEVYLFGRDTHNMSANEKTLFRLSELGFVFQDYALLPDLTALENVAVPLMMQGKYKKESYSKAETSLERVGLGHRLDNFPSQLSGGEQQRTSIARALAHNPKILFADEPTANLDNESSRTIMRLFQEVHRQGQTIIMVTHEEEYSSLSERIILLDDGKVISDKKVK